MKKPIVLTVTITLIVALLGWVWGILIPKHYVLPPLEKRSTTQYMTLSTGSKIGYTLISAQGDKKKHPIIYLHGGPGGRINNTTIEALSELSNDGYDVFLYDQVGGGYSNRLDDINEYTVDRHLKDLQAIIQQLGTDKAILIGQSWGCILATYFVSQYPENVEKIILTNPGPLYPYPNDLKNIPAPDSLSLQSPVFTNAQGNAATNNRRQTAIRFFATRFGIKLAADAEADEFSTYAGFEVNKSCVFDTSKIVKIAAVKSIPNLNGYYAGLMTFQNLQECQDPRPNLKGVEIPLLVIKAQYDNQKWGYTQEYLTLFKNSRLTVIPNAGHFIEIEQASELQRAIRAFL